MNDAELYQLIGPPSSRRIGCKSGEALLHVHVVDFLRAASLAHELKGVWFHIPNAIADAKHPMFGRQMTQLGKIKGAPDLCFVWDEGGGFVELKSGSGKLSTHQRLFRLWCEHHHIAYEIVTNIHEFKETLKKWKILNG